MLCRDSSFGLGASLRMAASGRRALPGSLGMGAMAKGKRRLLCSLKTLEKCNDRAELLLQTTTKNNSRCQSLG